MDRTGEGFAAANGKGLILIIDNRCLGTGCAQIDDARSLHGLLGKPGRTDRIRGIENGGTLNRTKHGYILQPHLRRPIFANGNSGVAAAKNQVRRSGMAGHADKIIGTAQKGREAGRHGDLSTNPQAQRGTDHILFGNVRVEETLRVALLE